MMEINKNSLLNITKITITFYEQTSTDIHSITIYLYPFSENIYFYGPIPCCFLCFYQRFFQLMQN